LLSNKLDSASETCFQCVHHQYPHRKKCGTIVVARHSGKKSDVRPDRLIVEREKFAPRVMVSAGVCFSGKGRLHFVDEKARVDAAYYVCRLLPELIAECKRQLPAGFIFQQDGAPAHTPRLAQDWFNVNCSGFIEKDQWLPNSPDFNPLD